MLNCALLGHVEGNKRVVDKEYLFFTKNSFYSRKASVRKYYVYLDYERIPINQEEIPRNPNSIPKNLILVPGSLL